MELTIAVLFCDKDVEKVLSLCEQIENKVKIAHEILLIDNRDDKSLELPNYETLVLEKNIGQYDARLKAVEKCNGKYIWFIDADDDILQIDEMFTEITDKESDLVYFCTQDNDGEKAYLNEPSKMIELLCGDNDSVTYSTDELSLYIASFIGVCGLWQAWIRKDFFVNCLKIFPKNHEWKHNEDRFTLSLLLVNSKTITWCSKAIYIYNIGQSNYQWSNVIPYERFNYLLKDYKSLDEEGQKLLGKYYELLFPKTDCYAFMMSGIINCTDENIDEHLKLIIDILGKEWVCNAVQNNTKGANTTEQIVSRIAELTETELTNYETYRLNHESDFENLTISDKKLTKSSKDVEIENAEKPFVSIVVTLIDRDTDTIPNFVQGIKSRVKVPYEIIIVDNRTERKDEELKINGARVISKGENLYQFESKRLASLNANGEYLWFVDADDCILGVNDDLDLDLIRQYPVVCFGFEEQEGEHFAPRNKKQNCNLADYQGRYTPRSTKTTDLMVIKEVAGVFTWNKWYRKTDFISIAEKIEEGKQIIVGEDEFYFNSVLNNNDSLLFIDDKIYIYDTLSGITGKFSLENAELFLKGYDDIFQITKNFNFSEIETNIMKISALSYMCYKIMDNITSSTERFNALRYIRNVDRDFVEKYKNILACYLYGVYGYQTNSKTLKYFLGNGNTCKCTSKENIELFIKNSETIEFLKCCKLSENAENIALSDFLKNTDKKTLLQNVTNKIPLNHNFQPKNAEHNCNGTVWCDFSESELKQVAVSCYSCNLHCTGCRKDFYSDETDIENYYKILESIKGMELDTIYLTIRGEPFLNKERLLTYLESLTVKDCKTVGAVTNATLLDENDIIRLKEISDKTGVQYSFIVSVDGVTKETYQASRRADYFDKVVENAVLLNKYGLLNQISYLVTELTVSDLLQAPKFWEEKGIKDKLHLIVCSTMTLGDFTNNAKNVTESEIFKEFTEKYPEIDISLPDNFNYNTSTEKASLFEGLFSKTEDCYADFNLLLQCTDEENLNEKLTNYMMTLGKENCIKLYDKVKEVFGKPYLKKNKVTFQYWNEETGEFEEREEEVTNEITLLFDDDTSITISDS